MLPLWIGAAVIGVGAAIALAVKDSSSDSSYSSSSSDYDDRRKEQEEREHKAKLESSDHLLEQQRMALQSKWNLKSLPKYQILMANHAHNAAYQCAINTNHYVKVPHIDQHAADIAHLQQELSSLDKMLNDMTKALLDANHELAKEKNLVLLELPTAPQTKPKVAAKNTDAVKAFARQYMV